VAVDHAPYDELLEQGQAIYAPTRIGRPGRGWAYWVLFPLAQALRAHWAIHVAGREHVRPGPAILVGNHLSLLDPVIVGLSNPWRLAFFTKVEVYESAGGAFFRATGQIPLRRGDEAATAWALAMSSTVVQAGAKLAVYPEATRSPDHRSLHRLHRRVLVPVLQANPDVPVHVMTIEYGPRRRGRIPVTLRFSPPLHLDVRTSSPQALTDAVRDELLALGGMPYVHQFGRSIKAQD
jgi:1-acyl-sn-glycerol-3-phosphate acyltransferase